jgi:L-iditol 2-dehydrogenase
MATPPTDGAFCEYVVWPGDFVYRLPDNVSFEEAALIEPLSVALQATKRAQISPGMSVAIVGAGPIGLTALLASLAHGAATIIISDIYPLRLELAAKLGASHAINVKDADQVQTVLDLTEGEGCDVVLETAGTPNTVRQSMAMVKRGGVVTLVGMSAELEFQVPMMDVIMREYDIRGVFRYANCHPVAIALLASGRVDVKPLITHEFPLAQAKEALDCADTRKDVAVKVLVKP